MQSLKVFEPETRDLKAKKKISKYLEDRRKSTPDPGRRVASAGDVRSLIKYGDVRLFNSFHLFLGKDYNFIAKPVHFEADRHGDVELSLDASVRSPVLWCKLGTR